MGRRILTKIINLQRFHHKQHPAEQPQQQQQQRLEQDLKHNASWELDDACILTRSYSSRSAFSLGDVSAKSVRFGECQVRLYSQVLGDHPYCSIGCPLELGWEFQQERAKTVNDFEAQRERRSRGELLLTPEERRTILSESVSEPNLRKACRRRACGKKVQRRIQREFFDTHK